MIKARHEEYRSAQNELPFVLYPALERTPFKRSGEQNWHEDLEIELCLCGYGTVLLNGEPYAFEKDDFIVVNENVIHYTGTEESLCYACLIVKADFCKQVGIDCHTLSFAPCIRNHTLLELFNELCQVYADTALPFRTARLHELLLRILILIAAKYAKRADLPNVREHRFASVKKAIEYIRENYTRKLTLDELAHAVYTDKYALCRDFKKAVGKTVVQYINAYRCHAAEERIMRGETVAEAAHACGFENLSYFAKTFQTHIGKLPSECKE